MAVLEAPEGIGYAQIRIDSQAGGERRTLWASVDTADWDLVSQHSWHVTFDAGLCYAQTVLRHEGRRTISMGRLLMGEGALGNLGRVNHRNGNGLDCRRANLELVTQSQILAKRKPSGGHSPYKGVTWDPTKGKWVAAFRRRKLGAFHQEKDAAHAFDEAALEHWGPQAYLNFPPYPEGIPMTGARARQLRFAIRQVLDTQDFQQDSRASQTLRQALATVDRWVNLPPGWFDGSLKPRRAPRT